MLEERRESATTWLVEYQQKLAWRYNRDVRKREFEARDLVLRKVVGNTRDVNVGKLALTWDHIESPPLQVQGHITWRIWMKDHFLGHEMPTI